MVNSIPRQVKKYFWGDDLDQLNWTDHKQYIVQTLLNKGDEKAISWLLQKTDLNEIRQMISQLKLDAKSHNFWKTYLS